MSKQVFILLLGTALAAMPFMNAQAEQPSEYEVKAAFIHNIAQFVEWPAEGSAAGRLKLCIVGRNPFGKALDALQGRAIRGKVWEVSPTTPNTNLRECGVVFIAASERNNLGQVLDAVKGSTALTVADSDGYAEQGVMVNFYLEQNRVRFEINAEAASRAGLKISSQLLKLARIVHEPGRMQ